MEKIYDLDELIARVDECGILRFWTESDLSVWTLSGIGFNAMWDLREKAVNSKRVAYGKFVQHKATFVSLDLLPYLCAMRRDGYDFDSLSDEGLVPNRETLIMKAVGTEQIPSYALGKSLGIKGFDSAVTSLQNKTYLCLQFKKSAMGTALLCRPEDVFGYDFVRSKYNLSPAECAEYIKTRAAIGIAPFSDKDRKKILSPAI